MFEHLRQFPTIIVTGPHRSGTTICAEMIAHDTGHTTIREEAYGFKSLRKFMWLILWTRVAKLPLVIQAPAMFHRLRLFGRLPGTAVVLMRRPLDELREARGRMYGVNGSKLSQEEQNKEELGWLGSDSGDAAEVKYRLWERWKRHVRNPFEVTYSDLADHPLWVRTDVRRGAGRKWHNRRIA
ncbi:MAG: hypothetical protein IIA72_05475 [Proteobacteria bacterium]|nr:hypothetical protein [Pseudomonadota bacterium]